jgi:protocatechuate 3,4-dioxygenase beta subunit
VENNIHQVHRLLKRRETLALLRAAGAAVLAIAISKKLGSAQTQSGQSSQELPTTQPITLPGCIVRPEQTEGPYFVDEKLNRSDIRSDPSDGSLKAGIPLQVTFQVSQVSGNSCVPLTGAIVDIWHCDALGVYSDVSDRSFNTVGQKFLRGYQVTDSNGNAQFTTIYPGWYPGRTVHIHFKIRTSSDVGKSYEFTSQLYFDDAVTDQVHAQAPYASQGQRRQRNTNDGIFRNGGDQLLLVLTKNNQGYTATFNIGLQSA